MTISYPLSLPSTQLAPGTGIRARASAAVSESPFTGEQQVYVQQLEVWSAQLVLPPMTRADAGGLAKLERAIRSLNGSIEQRAVAAVFNAQVRGVRA